MGVDDGFDPFALEPPEPVEDVVEAQLDAEESPPEPSFLVDPNGYGRGVARVTLADGTPVGVWLHDVHPDLDGLGVEELLLGMGLDARWAAWFGGWRSKAREAAAEITASPAVVSLSEAERRVFERAELVKAAFLARQKKEKT